jgi:tetratricopeptide (TPR) repeat protein
MRETKFKAFMLAVILLLFLLSGYSQSRKAVVYGTSSDSSNCGAYLSAYRGFFKLELYDIAMDTWLKAFDECPASSERLYLDGVTMYRSFIEGASEESVRENRIDTLMLIYDRRIENFGNEGNVLGRKGQDLLTYRGKDIEQLKIAYDILKRSIELQGKESREAAMLFFISAGISLNTEGILDDARIIDDYLTISGIMDEMEGRSSRRERTRKSIDEMMLKEDILSCEALNSYYESKFEPMKNDKAFLENLVAIYKISGCDLSDYFVSASEILYKIEPGSETAYNLAILFINRNDFEKAAAYLLEAAQGENINSETRAERYYELAVVSNASSMYCPAIEYAREAIRLKSDYGKAYMLLGDAFISSRKMLGDDFQQRTAFWAAADMYIKASSKDPSLSEEASQKLSDYSNQFPDKEEVFFRDIKDGDSYLVEGCINEYTTVRSRK